MNKISQGQSLYVTRKKTAILLLALLIFFTVPTIGVAYENLVPYREGTLWGFSDRKGKIVIPVRYEDASPFSEGYARVRLAGKEGFINEKGKEVVPLQYDEVTSFKGGRAHIITRRGYQVSEGIINRSGEVIVPQQYEYIREHYKGFAVVGKNFKQGLIDSVGKEILPPVYSGVYTPERNVVVVVSKQKYALFNSKGEKLTDFIYDYMGVNDDPYVIASLGGKTGFLDLNGNQVIAPTDLAIDPFKGNASFTAVRKEFKLGYMDRKGQVYFSDQYDEVQPFGEGLFKCKRNGKYGLLNAKREEVISPQYEYLHKLSEQLVCVSQEGKYGFVNTKGDVVIPFAYDRAENFQGEVAVVTKIENGKLKSGFINKKGKLVAPYQYDHIFPFVDGIATVKSGDKYGAVNALGQEIVAVKFDCNTPLSGFTVKDGVVEIMVNGRKSFVSSSGVEYFKD